MGCCVSTGFQHDTPTPWTVAKFHGDPTDLAQIMSVLSTVPPTTRPSNIAGWEAYGRVMHIVDGDTILVAIVLGSEVMVKSVRVLGCDTPELHSRNPHEKEAATKARDYVVREMKDQIVKIVTAPKPDKYGRLLASVIRVSDGMSLADNLISHGYARPYSGEKKVPFEQW